MRQMEIDDEGLDSTDRKLLAAIIQKFASGPVGVQALAAVLAEEVETIEDVYEPFLLRLGFLDRTPQGRIATEAARAHLATLGYEIPPPRRGDADMPPLWETCAELTGGFGPRLGARRARRGHRRRARHGADPILGHLPGDIVIQRDNVTIFIPLGTMLLSRSSSRSSSPAQPR